MTKKATKKAATKKKPSDPNRLAHFLGEQSTTTEREFPPVTVTRAEISRVMSVMGRKGGKIGGVARAAKLTPDERRETALKAARARWDKKPLSN